MIGTKPQTLVYLKLGLDRNKNNLCRSIFCKDVLSQFHNEKNLRNQRLHNRHRPQLYQTLLERERDFKRIYFATFGKCSKQTARPHAYPNQFKFTHHLAKRHKVLYDVHRQDFSKSRKLQQRQLGPFTVRKRVTKITYQIQDDNDLTLTKTVHRNQ